MVTSEVILDFVLWWYSVYVQLRKGLAWRCTRTTNKYKRKSRGNGEWGMGGGEGHVAIAYTIKLKHGERLFLFFYFLWREKDLQLVQFSKSLCTLPVRLFRLWWR